jgi:hypothetical protein
MQGKLKEKGLVRVAVYLNKDELSSMAIEAEKLKLRRVGLPTQIQAPHGFANEFHANTDGVSRLLKYCHAYWQRDLPKRLERKAALLKEVEELGV